MTGALPRPGTPFFGRRSALVRIEGLLDEHRLVTLTGVGGSGKTRLALRVAEQVTADSPRSVGWVELAPLSDPQLVGTTACACLSVRLAAGTSPIEALAPRLGSSRGLLVLDNCEHVLDGCVGLATALLDRCPRLRILATSREPLDLPEEVVWPVPTLTVPDLDGPEDRRVQEAEEAESVQLFVDRVRAARPDFQLTADNVEAVVRLCRHVDGIPLALELAAGRARALAPEQIARRLEEGLELLSQRGRRVPPRHRTMRATLEWSHDLLTQPERVLFRRLAVFGGGASLEACEAVCAGGSVAQADVLDLLTRLIDRSLLVVDDRGGVTRYRLLEPVRRFALERLEESAEHHSVRDRHAAHFRTLAAELAPRLRGPDRTAALQRLESEHDNLRAAWDHAAEGEDGAALARFARTLFWFWNFGGHFDEGRRRTEEVLERTGREGEAEPDLLWASGALAWMQGDYDAARARLEACVARCREASRRDLLPLALRELSGVWLSLGDLPRAAELYEESVDLLPAATRSWDRALALVVWADVRQALGDAEAAHDLREEARTLFGSAGDPWGRSLAHLGLGLQAAREGELDAARAHATEALALQRSGGDDWNLGQILVLLGEIEQRAGSPERAAELLLNGLEAFRAVGDRVSLAHALLCLAGVEAGRGRTLRAVRLAGAGHALAERLDAPYLYALATDDEREATVAGLREAAGEEAFVADWATGRAMSLEEAVAFALDVPERLPDTPPKPGSRAAAARLRIFGLGPPEVFRGRRRLRPADWTYALPRELLFYLLLHPPRTKEQIGLDFWPEATEDQLRGRFRTALYQLRRALGGTEWVQYENGRYAFNRSLDYWFDVEEFEADLDAAEHQWESDPEAAAAALRRAVELYRGELLDGEAPGRWASEPRDRLRRRYLKALLALGAVRSTEGAHETAAALFRRAIEVDEFNERAHHGLARSLAEGGDRAGALRHLDDFARLLGSELGLDPSPATARLRSSLKRGRDA